MKLFYTLFIVVTVLLFNSSAVFAETDDELMIKCEDNKDANACMDLADNYGNANDYTNAYKYIDKACENGEVAGCLIQGSLTLKGVGVKKDHKKAIKYYNKACIGGEMVGCGVIGLMYEKGVDVKLNFKKALEFYQLACVGGEILGCDSYDALYNRIELPIKCDEYKDMNACITVGEKYAENDDFKNSFKYLKKACDGGDMLGCAMQGYLYDKGVGVKQDNDQALKLYKKACDGKLGSACESFADLYKKECSTNSKKFCKKYE